MVKTCRPIWKLQTRETSPYMSGTDLRRSVAFRWRILPGLSRCCANQDRCPDHARSPIWERGCQCQYSFASLDAHVTIGQASGAKNKTTAAPRRLKHQIKSRLTHDRRNTANPTKS